MKKYLVSPVCAFLTVMLMTLPVSAGLSWKTIEDLRLEQQPLDVAASGDGRFLFVLAPGQVLVYSVSGNGIDQRIPVEKDFDSIAYAPGLHAVVLTSSGSRNLRILKLHDIHELDLSGLPFKGPENAPVTIAVFSGYQ